MSESGEKVKYLRRLKTRDGVVGPIEETPQPQYREMRALGAKLHATVEVETLGASMYEARRYVARREVPAILIEMEEE